MNEEIYKAFEEWLNNIMKDNMPDNVQAYNFNIYDETDESGKDLQTYGVQLIASNTFDEEDGGEWACNEIYSSEENIFCIDHSDEENADSKRGLEFISSLIKKYLDEGFYKDKFKQVKAVGAGFIDGDIEIIRCTK